MDSGEYLYSNSNRFNVPIIFLLDITGDINFIFILITNKDIIL